MLRSSIFKMARRFASTATPPPSSSQQPPKKGIKALMAKYGYSALGVYLGLSAVDLPLSFLFVHSVGPERMEAWTSQVKGYFGYTTEEKSLEQDAETGHLDPERAKDPQPTQKWFGIDRRLIAEFGVAYALHKSLIFIRIPITAAITPAVVRQLQKWGFNVGKAVTTTGLGSKATSKQRFGSWFF
ncbi:uncharacterized protein SAPINGB_P000437 [Magnusiomyces paraingens]|uniref:DUF1279 domain-containing protein n=1 Tax=Magnusiomyces paraingens TaxID=2606893 RepID=A0A5E8B119_9ASCO|nr:uncharacterized protein SAPINGB_P000437 [Saprochaete ingens]VVT44500.1 unnamed protein product [Saprochaete ingens]